MRSSDHVHYSSDSENDDALLADIQALSKACLDTASVDASDDGAAGDVAQTHGVATAAATSGFAADSSDSDDDFEFLRDVQHKYGGGNGADPARPNFALPLMNSESDDDDDFEILRAIQRRFGQYSASGTNCVGVGESEGMSSNPNNDLDLPVRQIYASGIMVRFDGNGEGLCDSSPKDDVEKQRSQNPELPKCALAFIDAIRKNRLAQKHLRNQMTSVEARMEKVKEMIKRVKVIWEFDVQERRKMARKRQDDRVQLISVRNRDNKKLPSAMKYGPPENSRVENYRIAFQQYPQWITKEKWTKEDRINLQKGVIQQLQKCLLLKSMDRMNKNEGHECTDGLDEIMSKIGDVQDPHIIRSFLPNVDWEELASAYLPKRSGPECRTRWINFEDLLINHDPKWSRLEDKSLLDCVQQFGYNWVVIAENLGTNRTPYQCLVRYQRSLNRSLMNREWTPAQDAELTAAVQTYGESNWTVVASVLEGRAAPQCSNRWLKTLLPSKQRKGRWNPDEDKRLKIAVMIMGSKCWNKIAEFVPGRTQARCRDRWMNCLDPSLNFDEWTEEEDAKLEEAIRVHGYCWAKIATCIPPRTDNQCRRRWKTLFPDEALRVQAERKAVRDALPSNFVDREPNRPTLEANDFVPLLLGDTEFEHANSFSEGEKKPTRRKKSSKVSDTSLCSNDTGPSRKRTRNSGVKGKICAEADLKKSVKGVLKNRKGGENETTNRCRHTEVDAECIGTSGTVVKEILLPETELDGSSVRIKENQQDISSVSEVLNCYAGTIKHHDGDETVLHQSEVTGRKPKRQRSNPKEPADWEHVPLAILFGLTEKFKRRRKV